MEYKVHNNFYVPSSKTDLIKSILPHWKGKKKDLGGYSKKRLYAIYYKIRNDQFTNFMKKEERPGQAMEEVNID